ncbi:hypothetical protein U9M48_044393 [Paspalum notatum var. saurae]|uniref:Protein kinase domain-containing protein n=1 Tax=Paspalum notatum var. saurae TaxID=547442 RepID=A0AAQ3UZ28_PASNO
MRSSESVLYDLSTLRAATDNFSAENKLGEGGFGPVYKGMLQNGREIAVKRLSAASQQGLVEMKNEVVMLAKLQHRNLVRLLGCCIEEHERLLVYEFLSNNSLDKILFDPVRPQRQRLGWGLRHKIIEGIGRGLLYLHEESRLTIIHRDLKASNILLDAGMNPKISDFGLAKLFNVDSSVGNTSRIAGTYGYMAPEYALHGIFSAKSDVYSYGVLVLEIVTGRRNTFTAHQGSGPAEDLLTFVWRHWSRGNVRQLLDCCPAEGRRPQEILNCIHVALLCVQEDPQLRPGMASVVVMLNSRSVTLPPPTVPAYALYDRAATAAMAGGEEHGSPGLQGRGQGRDSSGAPMMLYGSAMTPSPSPRRRATAPPPPRAASSTGRSRRRRRRRNTSASPWRDSAALSSPFLTPPLPRSGAAPPLLRVGLPGHGDGRRRRWAGRRATAAVCGATAAVRAATGDGGGVRGDGGGARGDGRRGAGRRRRCARRRATAAVRAATGDERAAARYPVAGDDDEDCRRLLCALQDLPPPSPPAVRSPVAHLPATVP